MPAPDPFGINASPDSETAVLYHLWLCGNPKHRQARAVRVLRNLARPTGWTCPECGAPVPFTRRADALYCREACRKRAKRRRS